MQLLLVGIVVLIAAAGAWFFQSSKPVEVTQAPVPVVETPVQSPAATETTPTTPTTAASNPLTTYKDGTYANTGTYRSPAGTEHVEISITLAHDVVTAATFKGDATNPKSIANQKKFSDGYQAMVVGKPIDSINLTVVNGSSLTGAGFMEALTKIKTQAHI